MAELHSSGAAAEAVEINEEVGALFNVLARGVANRMVTTTIVVDEAVVAVAGLAAGKITTNHNVIETRP